MKYEIRTAALGLAASLMLGACGGGGSDAAPQTPDNNTLTVQGTAATGAAIAGATVEVKCAAGSGSATTATSGNFTVSIEGGSLPCVLRVTPASGATLHSVADGSGAGSVTVNLTPLSELIVALAAGGDAATLFADFDAAAQAKIAASALATARTTIASALAGVVDLSGIDPLKDALVAANGSTAGNAFDQKLDALNDALHAAKTDVAKLQALIAANGASAAEVIKTETRPTSATCKGVRSGAYRYINPNETGDWSTHVVTYDASALTATLQDGTVLQLASDGGCKFSYGPNVLVASSAGVVIERYVDTGDTARVAMAIPEQTLALSDLMGTWNTIYLTPANAGATFAGGNSVVTMDAAGNMTSALDCMRAEPCTPRANVTGTFSVNASGGFDYVNEGQTSRVFAYRAASGDTMFAMLLPFNLGVIVGTKQAPLAVPSAGTSTYWDLTVNAMDQVLALSDQATVNTPNGDGATYTSVRQSDGRVVVYTMNKPRDGLRYRPDSNLGTPTYANALITLPIRGMGLSFYIGETVHLFGVSVLKS